MSGINNNFTGFRKSLLSPPRKPTRVFKSPKNKNADQVAKPRQPSMRECAKAKSKLPSLTPRNRTSRSRSIAAPVPPQESALSEHLLQVFHACRFIQGLSPPSPWLLETKKVHLHKPLGFQMKKTVVFDLDETLVHPHTKNQGLADTYIKLKSENGTPVQLGINVRPFARECLAEISRFFEVIVFSASNKQYVDAVVDFLDPDKAWVHHRLYKNSCCGVHGLNVKDLRILDGRDLKDVVIVDNSVYSFGYQLDNGIPVISWTNDYSDKELLNLIDYLKILSTVNDVREVNRFTFNLGHFCETYLAELGA